MLVNNTDEIKRVLLENPQYQPALYVTIFTSPANQKWYIKL